MSAPRAIVVGGGPAGLSAALGLAKTGYAVTLLEQHPSWTPPVCGSFLSPDAVRHLETLGVLDEAASAGAREVGKVLLTAGKTRAASVAFPLPGLALPREDLERILRHAAELRGVTLRSGCRAESQTRQPDGTWLVAARDLRHGAAEFTAEILVAADGRYSRLGRRGHARSRRPGWYGWNADYARIGQRPGELSLHFFPGGYVGILTFAGGRSNVCGLLYNPDKFFAVEASMAQARRTNAALDALLRDAVRASIWRGVGPLPYGWKPDAGGIFLAGDAAGMTEPFMGEGLAQALASGPLLHEALSHGDPDAKSADDAVRYYEKLGMKRRRPRQRWGFWLRGVLHAARFSAIPYALLLRPRPARYLSATFQNKVPGTLRT